MIRINKNARELTFLGIHLSGRQDGDNFKKDDREFEVGGKEGFTESDITSFISDMSDVMGVELGGFTFSDFGSEETSLIQLLGSTKWGKNEKDLTNYPRPTGKLNRGSNTVFKGKLYSHKEMFHTHYDKPTLSTTEKDRNKYGEILKAKPNFLKAFIIGPSNKKYYYNKYKLTEK